MAMRLLTKQISIQRGMLLRALWVSPALSLITLGTSLNVPYKNLHFLPDRWGSFESCPVTSEPYYWRVKCEKRFECYKMLSVIKM